MIDINLLYYGSVENKRLHALDLFAEYGPSLFNTVKIREGLENLDKLTDELQNQMASMIMFSLCIDCGQSQTGGCCSYYMANETDSVLIVINLLLGIKVKPQRDDFYECCYLGHKGCILRVKPIFCLNYNCQKILRDNDTVTLKNLESAAANVLRQQIFVEELILRHIRLA